MSDLPKEYTIDKKVKILLRRPKSDWSFEDQFMVLQKKIDDLRWVKNILRDQDFPGQTICRIQSEIAFLHGKIQELAGDQAEIERQAALEKKH